MRIIESGRLPPITQYTGKCPICGCKFECNVEEVYWEDNKFGGIRYNSCYCPCPESFCKYKVMLFPKE